MLVEKKIILIWMKFYIMTSNDKSIIVSCMSNTDTYSDDKQSHMDVNYKFVVDLVQICNQFNKKYVHISTDYVYSNSIGFYSENDVPFIIIVGIHIVILRMVM